MHTVAVYSDIQQITDVVPMFVKLLHLHCSTSMICMAQTLITSTEIKKNKSNQCRALTQKLF